MQRHRISSDIFLLFYKFVWPGFMSLAILIMLPLAKWDTTAPLWVWILGMLMLISLLTIVIRHIWSLKSVDIDDKYLYISGIRKEIVVPMSQIRDVSALYWSSPQILTIHLQDRSDFGRTIRFVTPLKLVSYHTTHPLVNELLTLAASNGTD